MECDLRKPESGSACVRNCIVGVASFRQNIDDQKPNEESLNDPLKDSGTSRLTGCPEFAIRLESLHCFILSVFMAG